MLSTTISFVFLALITCSLTIPLLYTHQETTRSNDPLLVDLGYAIYRGTVNLTTSISSWKGIRFTAPPTGPNRWQLPLMPETNRTQIINATAYGPMCPQAGDSSGMPASLGITGDEDCLFLNVFAPANIKEPLPVMVWIHGGGYGAGNGRYDFTEIINENENDFIGVAIQYRLGAFGFLSSQDVFDNGVVNAGLYDQYFALQWVQEYITLFGGDPDRVTISGESAGGGSVMLLDMAYGGSIGTSLFQNAITASPYCPTQNAYNSTIATLRYDAFVDLAGCSSTSSSKFECLTSASTEVLQNASTYVSTSGVYGTWTFLPVTDGALVQDLPSRQLAAGKVNGRRMLTGNNGVEGSLFVPKNITTETDVTNWLRVTFPGLSEANITTVLAQYPINDIYATTDSPRFATNGLTDPTANEVSPVATGQEQRAINIYSEITFVCPSYWLAQAHSSGTSNYSAGYKYQYSVVPSTHGQDVSGYFSPPNQVHSVDFSIAFKRVIGNFVTTNNPSISNVVADGLSTENAAPNPASQWPTFDAGGWPMVNLNETFAGNASIVTDETRNAITLVNAYTWEGGRGERCDFWRTMAIMLPT